MSNKYIQDNILLTKEAIADHILRQRIEQAKRYRSEERRVGKEC